jgi:predicted esterase
MLARTFAVLLAVTVGVGAPRGGAMASANDETDLEASVCGRLREPLAFWLFRSAAGRPDAKRINGVSDLEPISFLTRDGRTLRGYSLRAVHPWGYLLIAQGNAMLADQIIGEFGSFRDMGLDVYLYDYRGYGLSGGKSRLKAIVSDYGEFVSALNARDYRRRFLYGLSMGGVILSNALKTAGDYDAAVIDSSPSRISPLGCPEAYDPVNHLPADCTRIMIILGHRDRVVPPADVEEMAATAESRGAAVLRDLEFAHPFQDVSYETQRRRFREVAEFFKRWQP